MKLIDIIKTANSNLLRNKIRTFLTILAIFIGSFTIILNTAVNTGVNSFIDKQVASAGGDGYIEIAPAAMLAQIEGMMGGNNGPQEYNPEQNASELNYIDAETLTAIEDINGIIPGSVRPLRNVRVEYVTSNKTHTKWKLRVNELPSNNINIDLTAGNSPRTDSDQPEITLLPGFAEVLGFVDDAGAIGQTVTLAIKNQATGELINVDATVVGVQAPSVVSMGRSWLNAALNDRIFAASTKYLPAEYANRVMFATAEFDPEADLDFIKKGLEELNLSGMTIDDSIGMMKTFFDIILIVFSIFGGIALLAASIGIINTLLMSVQERTREIGLMKAMGLSSGKVFLSFSFEAISLGFWGSLLGIGLSMLVGNTANTIFHQPGMFLADFPTFSLVEFTPANCIIIALGIMFIAFLAGTLPAIKAARKNPIDALRYE
ncbi:ABC transporter permease [Candidatus Saccharibacteria bacterium]|nr:ABC transporter permease [Candidatus Saccharibacteria bacterium]